jgi:DNA helicase-2/ATP-dependent DNA helicase PcrA
VEVDDSRLEETKKQVERHIEGIKNRSFKPCTGEFCNKCELTKICRWKKR